MNHRKKVLALWLGAAVLLLAGAVLTGSPGRAESVQEAMRDAVLHGANRISLLGLKEVNPGMISALTVTGALLAAAACIRVLVIPRFQYVPGRLQLLLEEAVGLFDRMAKTSSPHRSGFLGLYIFSAGAYIFVGTLFELLGLQAVTTAGRPITLPAPLSDVNAAIALGCLSYLVILSGGNRQDPQGVLPAHLHELPPVRGAAQRASGDGAGVLFCRPQLCPAGGGGGAVHPAPRVDPDLCSNHAHGPLLRRGVRARPQGAEEHGPERLMRPAPHILKMEACL